MDKDAGTKAIGEITEEEARKIFEEYSSRYDLALKNLSKNS